MAKRRLTNNQERRIASNQKNILHDDAKTESDLNNTRSGLVISHYGRQLIIETDDKTTYQCKLRQNLGNITCGDTVLFEIDDSNDANHGVVVALNERINLLEKTGFAGKAKPVAANINKVLIICAIKPEPNHYLIDRYLVATENLPAEPIIVLNKMDLADDHTLHIEKELRDVYESIGYNVIATSVKTNRGMDELHAALADATSILVGLSGVGKSSLVKVLLPETEIRIGATSTSTGEGKHTTTVSSLYHLKNGGNLIDSPGVRDFTPNNTSKQEIELGFTEFKKYRGCCKFSNCTHEHEPGCAIIKALENKKVLKTRFDSFKKMLSELDS